MVGPEVNEERDWWAIVGPLPAQIASTAVWRVNQDRRYAGPATIGSLALRCGGRRLAEHHRLEPWSLDGQLLSHSWPVIVEGAAAGHEWPEIVAAAAPHLHRACSLISLAWFEPWQVRTGPTDPSQLPAAIPDSWIPSSQFSPSPEPQAPGVPEALPEWVSEAWNRLDGDRQLTAAIDSWHEGMLLMPLHPSYALAAFVASIEEASPSPYVGASTSAARPGERFWAAVSLVADPTEVQSLKRAKVYRKRSATAHGSKLYGVERVFGARLLLRFDRSAGGMVLADPGDETGQFVLELLPRMAEMARRVLLSGLDAGT